MYINIPENWLNVGHLILSRVPYVWDFARSIEKITAHPASVVQNLVNMARIDKGKSHSKIAQRCDGHYWCGYCVISFLCCYC